MTSVQETEFKLWYRRQFLCNVCHVCKNPPTTESVSCADCSLVSYCSPAHREEDADDHEDICEAFKSVANLLGTRRPHDKAHLLGADHWREFRLGLVNLCSKHLGRSLIPWEIEICLFPPLCVICHKFSVDLEKCPKCYCVSWCSPEHCPKDHLKYCDYLNLYRNILKRKLPKLKAPAVLPPGPKTMEDLSNSLNLDLVEFSLLSEVATSPLTMRNYLTELKDAVVHLIGPEPQFEANNLAKWDVFLFSLLPAMSSLTLHFIGPEIGPLPQRVISKNGRTLKCIFHQVLYHQFAAQTDDQPSLLCALNPGLYRPQGYNGQDSWAATIDAMFRYSGVPVLVTAYTEKEINLDNQRIAKQIPCVRTIAAPSRNPFSSWRPLMNFVSDEAVPVVFKNAYYSVLTA